MSARPRPVTATLPPPPLAPHRPRLPLYESSNDSINSLISVLGHESCEQLDSCDSESPAHPATVPLHYKTHPGPSHWKTTSKTVLTEHKTSNKAKTTGHQSASCNNIDNSLDRHNPCFTNDNIVSETNGIIVETSGDDEAVKNKTDRQYSLKSQCNDSCGNLALRNHAQSRTSSGTWSNKTNKCQVTKPLPNIMAASSTPSLSRLIIDENWTAWERWVVEKAKADRVKKIEECEEQRRQKLKEEEDVVNKKNKELEVAANVRKWLDEHNAIEKKKHKQEAEKKKREETLKSERKTKVKEDSSNKYEEWLEKLKKKEIEIKKQLKEKEKKDTEEKERKKKKNEAALAAWCERNKNRPRTAPSSYAYSMGKLTGYYDSNAYPVPSYVNPAPWQDIEIPQANRKHKQTQCKMVDTFKHIQHC